MWKKLTHTSSLRNPVIFNVSIIDLSNSGSFPVSTKSRFLARSDGQNSSDDGRVGGGSMVIPPEAKASESVSERKTFEIGQDLRKP